MRAAGTRMGGGARHARGGNDEAAEHHAPRRSTLSLRFASYFAAAGACLATIMGRRCSYALLVRIFFCSSSYFDLYGRPATILLAVASPTPGSFIRSSFDAELMSTGCFGAVLPVEAAGFVVAVVLAGAAVVAVAGAAGVAVVAVAGAAGAVVAVAGLAAADLVVVVVAIAADVSANATSTASTQVRRFMVHSSRAPMSRQDRRVPWRPAAEVVNHP